MTDTKITVARATAIIVAFTVLSKVLGFVREMALAYVFGVGAATDAFLVASTIPAIIFAVLGGALTAGAVPLFTAYRARWGEKEAWLLKRSTGGLVSFAGMRRDALKVLVASLACGLAAGLMNAGLAGTLAHGTAAVFARLLASGSAGLFVFGVATWFLGVTEFRALVEKVLVFAFRGRHTKAVTG